MHFGDVLTTVKGHLKGLSRTKMAMYTFADIYLLRQVAAQVNIRIKAQYE